MVGTLQALRIGKRDAVRKESVQPIAADPGVC